MDKRKDREHKEPVGSKPPRGYTEEEWAREREKFRKWFFQELKKYKEALRRGEISEEEIRQRDREAMVVAYLRFSPFPDDRLILLVLRNLIGGRSCHAKV